MDEVVEGWPGVADDLCDLAAAVDQVQDHLPRLAPGLKTRSRQLLSPPGPAVPATTVPVDDAKAAEAPCTAQPVEDEPAPPTAQTLATEVPATTAALRLVTSWLEVEEHPGLQTALGIRTEEAVRREAIRSLHQAGHELRAAETGAEVAEAGVDELLAQARARALQLTPLPSAEDAEDAEDAQEGHRGVGPSGPTHGGLGLPLVGRLPGLARALGRAVTTVRGVDLFWLGLAFFTVVWTLMQTLYVGTAWGGLTDHVAMFLAAAGGTAVLAPVLQGLGNLTAGPLRLKKPADTA